MRRDNPAGRWRIHPGAERCAPLYRELRPVPRGLFARSGFSRALDRALLAQPSTIDGQAHPSKVVCRVTAKKHHESPNLFARRKDPGRLFFR